VNLNELKATYTTYDASIQLSKDEDEIEDEMYSLNTVFNSFGISWSAPTEIPSSVVLSYDDLRSPTATI
jgi:hypothetical protein